MIGFSNSQGLVGRQDEMTRTEPSRQPLRVRAERIWHDWKVPIQAATYLLVSWTLLVIWLSSIYFSDLRAEVAREKAETLRVVAVHRRVIIRELKRMESDLRYLSQHAMLKNQVDGSQEYEDLAEDYAGFLREIGVYSQIRLLGYGGRELLRVSWNGESTTIATGDRREDREDRYHAKRVLALEPGQVHFSAFDLDVEDGKTGGPRRPIIRIAMPIANRKGKKSSVLGLSYIGGDLLDRLSVLGQQSPGRTMLLSEDGYYLNGTGDSRERGFMFGQSGLRFDLEHPAAWKRMKQDSSGQFETEAGLLTFDTVRLPCSDCEDGRAMRIVSLVTGADTHLRIAAVYHRLVWIGLAGTFFLFIGSYQLAHTRQIKRDHLRSMANSQRRLRTLSAQVLAAQEQERKRIARDLHDEIGQVGTAIHLHLQRALDAGDGEKKDQLIRRADEGIEVLIRWTHDMAARIRPSILDDLGLEEAVLALAQRFKDASGIEITVDISVGDRNISGSVREQTYRIVQEALTNVAKHSRAKKAVLRIEATDEMLELEVSDDGIGFDTGETEADRLGILGIYERAALVGGHATLTSRRDRGTRINVTLPIEGKTARPSDESKG